MRRERIDDSGRRWLEVPSPWSGFNGRLRALCRTDESASDVLRAIGTGDTGRPYIVEDDTYRELHFTRFASQSAMLIAEPTELVSGYTRKMMAFLLFAPRPHRILMIGLGGGSLAKYCYQHLPGAFITVVEPDPDVLALRDQFCIPPDDFRFQVVQADGAEFVERGAEHFDVILVDGYDHLGIAPSLESAAFYSGLARLLSPHGVVVMNLLGDAWRLANHARLAQGALNAQLVLVPMIEDTNTLLFGLREPALQSMPDGMESAARRLKRALKLDFPYFLKRINEGALLRQASGRLPLSEK
jgi:spermidine synthase